MKMSVKKNIERITARMVSLGTYKPEFDLAIKNLAENLESREKRLKSYQKGEGPLKDYKDLDARVLDYMKELSLTHQRMKRRATAEIQIERKPSILDAINEIVETE